MHRLILYLLLLTYGYYTFGPAVGKAMHTAGHYLAEGAYEQHLHPHAGGHEHHETIHLLLSQDEPVSPGPDHAIISLLLNVLHGILEPQPLLLDIQGPRSWLSAFQMALEWAYLNIPSPPPRPLA